MKYDMLVGVDSLSNILSDSESFNSLKSFHEKNKDWIFGYLSYDLKNELEDFLFDKARIRLVTASRAVHFNQMIRFLLISVLG